MNIYYQLLILLNCFSRTLATVPYKKPSYLRLKDLAALISLKLPFLFNGTNGKFWAILFSLLDERKPKMSRKVYQTILVTDSGFSDTFCHFLYILYRVMQTSWINGLPFFVFTHKNGNEPWGPTANEDCLPKYPRD